MQKTFLTFILIAFGFAIKAQEVQSIKNIESIIHDKEISNKNIKPNNQAKIIWSESYKEKQSPIAFVYLHGFGASSREGEPIMSQLSKKYNANVYMSRLKEHGISREDSFSKLTPDNYIETAKEALSIGKLIGKKIILVSTSTGGSLSLKLASEDNSIAGLIMYSPFIDLKNPAFKMITTPEGKAGFIKMNKGSKIMKQERPKEESKYWSTIYHIDGYESLIKMIVKNMTPETFSKVKIPAFVGYYYKNEKEQDQVVSVPAILKMFDGLGTPENKKVKKAFPKTGNHVIGCDLRSKDWKSVYNETVSFIDEVILEKEKQYSFDLQGHRGARGLSPENTIQAFDKALELGVNTLELDVVISKDNKVVVSHEPWLNDEVTLDSKGKNITKEDAKAFNIYKNKYKKIKSYDVGSIGNPKFLEQKKEKAYKPLLSEVITFSEAKNDQIRYNVEIKSTPTDEKNGFQPSVAEFSDLVIAQLKNAKLPLEKITVQSFDPRVLEYIHKTYPAFTLAFLTYQNDFETNLKMLSFVPEIYSPYFILLNKEEVKTIQNKNMKVIPWTVNKKDDMINLLKMGVDGIITDYPNIAIPLRK
ncbi:Glycerophosphoryl diester phosphodiesterase [Polaribacter sp. KT25b]|uniref:glycerophosphodiester phosphodiesterase family protein n=1 Tax=Polaribacter sp. KT25b TaxID=1855336 RepID=UPI00087A76D2|nr:glycerophosphodiester phosphodiesterase family protein [Polaribacter sp. KT25b]SDR72098.1 Glycerophosphoryl diester phosphodiesterase [Polaribacter sp. KT25b]